MISKLIYAILLTLMPVTELRIGLPLAISYAIENNVPVFLVFILIISLNILLVFFVFYFLDRIHSYLLRIRAYKKLFKRFLKRFQKKVDKFEKKYEKTEFGGLVLLVAVPVPGTGAWSGCLLAWVLGLDRKRSILAISLGVLIAGVIILAGSLGFVKLFNMF